MGVSTLDKEENMAARRSSLDREKQDGSKTIDKTSSMLRGTEKSAETNTTMEAEKSKSGILDNFLGSVYNAINKSEGIVFFGQTQAAAYGIILVAVFGGTFAAPAVIGVMVGYIGLLGLEAFAMAHGPKVDKN